MRALAKHKGEEIDQNLPVALRQIPRIHLQCLEHFADQQRKYSVFYFPLRLITDQFQNFRPFDSAVSHIVAQQVCLTAPDTSRDDKVGILRAAEKVPMRPAKLFQFRQAAKEKRRGGASFSFFPQERGPI